MPAPHSQQCGPERDGWSGRFSHTHPVSSHTPHFIGDVSLDGISSVGEPKNPASYESSGIPSHLSLPLFRCLALGVLATDDDRQYRDANP